MIEEGKGCGVREKVVLTRELPFISEEMKLPRSGERDPNGDGVQVYSEREIGWIDDVGSEYVVMSDQGRCQ